jgi:nitroreductase
MKNIENLLSLFSKRRSIRQFNNEEIDEETFIELIEAATWAPNGCHAEPWFFYVIRDESKIQEMREAVIATNPDSNFYKQYQTFHNARYVISICIDMEKRWYHRALENSERGVEAIDNPDYFSVAAAAENLILAAHAKNLGTCWIGVSEAFRAKLEEVIEVEDNHMLAINIAIGHYDEIPPNPGRKPAEDVLKFI